MGKKLIVLAFSIAMLAASAAAQTVTGSGTTKTGSSTVGNSPIAVSGSNDAIGTTTPASKLRVIGQTAIGQNTNGTEIIDAYNGDAYTEIIRRQLVLLPIPPVLLAYAE